MRPGTVCQTPPTRIPLPALLLVASPKQDRRQSELKGPMTHLNGITLALSEKPFLCQLYLTERSSPPPAENEHPDGDLPHHDTPRWLCKRAVPASSGCHGKTPQTRSSNDRNSFSHSFGGRKSEVTVPSGLVSGASSVPGLHMAAFSLCLHTTQREPAPWHLSLEGR